jgi:hypothetical protein
MFMCAFHWGLLPHPLKHAIWKIQATQRAINYGATKEGRVSVKWREEKASPLYASHHRAVVYGIICEVLRHKFGAGPAGFHWSVLVDPSVFAETPPVLCTVVGACPTLDLAQEASAKTAVSLWGFLDALKTYKGMLG